MYLRSRPSSSLISRRYAVFAFSWGPSNEFLSFLCKGFLRHLFTCTPPEWFPFFSIININKLESFTERLITPSLAACGPSPLYFYLMRLYLSYDSLCLISSCPFMSWPFVVLGFSYVRFGQTWSDAKIPNPFGELLGPFTYSCFLLLVGRYSVLVLFHLCRVRLFSLWS